MKIRNPLILREGPLSVKEIVFQIRQPLVQAFIIGEEGPVHQYTHTGDRKGFLDDTIRMFGAPDSCKSSSTNSPFSSQH
jgi:hypothetical protein